MIKRILTCLAFISLASVSSVFAQGVLTTSTKPFDDATLERARNNYWNSIRTSGDEKDLSVIERKAYDAMRNVQNRTMFKTLSSAAWTPIGSSVDGHSSGRIRGIAIDPTNTNVVYIAAAGGGIWKTNDITAKPVQWMNLSDRLPTTNFGSIAIDPSNPNVLYAGTGESQGDGYQDLFGMGLYKTVDGGNNWTQILDKSKTGAYCSQILVDETNSQRVYVATGTAGANGFQKSTDGGATWKGVNVGIAPLSIVYNASNPERLYVSGFGGNVYRSTDYGDTWTKFSLGASPAGRVTLACAPSNPDMVYALVGRSNTRTTLGIWISTDAGQTWQNKYLFNTAIPEDKNSNPNPLGTQQEWCNAIAVRPILASQIVVAGLDVYSSGNSGATMQNVSNWQAKVNATNYVHADIHHLQFVGNTLYACTDGGIAITSALSSYAQWATDANQGLATLQFVGADADKDFTFALGGCQDNGTLRAQVSDPEFHLTRGGDGGRTWISPDDAGIAYSTYVYTTFYKSLDSGKTWGGTNLVQANTGLYQDANFQGGEGAPFYPAYDVSSDGTVIAYGGNRHIWISMSGGEDAFTAHQSDKVIGSAYTIHLSQQDPTYMFAGSGSSVWRSTDEGATWTSKSIGEPVTGIVSDRRDHNKVYIVTQGTGAAYKHFYVSTDGGATFSSPTTQLSGIPCWSVAFDPAANRLFIGTDNGPMYSEDDGVTWLPLLNGIPYARVTSLKIKGNHLLASTYGRGLFALDMSQINGVATAVDQQGMQITSVSPNPLVSGTATISFALPTAGYCEARLFDALGRELRVIDKNYYTAGNHEVRFSKGGLTSGSYLVTLISGGKSVSSKLVIE